LCYFGRSFNKIKTADKQASGSDRPTEETPSPTPDASRTLQAPSQIPRTTATFTGQGTRSRTDQSLSAPDSQQQKVSAVSHIITVSKEDFEKSKAQLEQSQRNKTEIQKELQTTQQRALTQDIQLKREITQLTQK